MIIIKKIPRVNGVSEQEKLLEEVDIKMFTIQRKLNKKLLQLKNSGSINDIKKFVSQLKKIKLLALKHRSINSKQKTN